MTTRPLFFLGAFSLIALAAAGADSAPPMAVPPDAPHETLALTMNEAVVRALDANLEITVERLKPQIAEQRRRAAVGILDMHFESAFTSESLETPQNTRDFFATGRSVEVLDEDNLRFEGTLGGQLPTGTRYSVTIKSYSLKNTLNREALARFYPEFTSSAAFTVTQPLLRGFGRKATMVEANVATSELKASEHALRGRVDQIAANVLDAYVEATYGRELVHVITDRIALAERLRAENDKRFKQGLMAPIDVLQAESTKAAAEIELIRARSFQTEAENRLRELLFTDFAAAADISFTLVDPLKEVVLNESLPALRSLALERSAEYRVAEQQVVTEKMKVAYARNQLLPRFHDDRLHPVRQGGDKRAEGPVRVHVEPLSRVPSGYHDQAVIAEVLMEGHFLVLARRELLPDLLGDAPCHLHLAIIRQSWRLAVRAGSRGFGWLRPRWRPSSSPTNSHPESIWV